MEALNLVLSDIKKAPIGADVSHEIIMAMRTFQDCRIHITDKGMEVLRKISSVPFASIPIDQRWFIEEVHNEELLDGACVCELDFDSLFVYIDNGWIEARRA
jgi:hypothetical protein